MYLYAEPNLMSPSRRDLLLAPIAASWPMIFGNSEASAGPVDPAKTFIQQADAIVWEAAIGSPPRTVEYGKIWSDVTGVGPYMILVKWYPGHMSAPHWYETDRHCVVVSGTWWVASGETFDPASTVPVPAGGFVRRTAKTWHYDGVPKDAKEPAVIVISGVGPITFHMKDDGSPKWRDL